MYCGAACNKADWDDHKEMCKFSQRLLQPQRDLPPNTLYVSARAVHETILDSGFAVEQARLSVFCPPTRCHSCARAGSREAERMSEGRRLSAERV